MELTFLGGTGTVTGSKYLIAFGTYKILVDCGLYQGIKNLRLRNWEPLPFSVKSLDAVILTHAHIDHSGYLPALIKQGYEGPIYSSQSTRDLCKILLPDAGHLQEEDAAYANKKGFSKHKPALPLYTQIDGENTLDYFKTLAFHEKEILPGLTLQMTPAGHILGASCVHLFFEDSTGDKKTLVFSGDLGRMNDLIMYPPEPIASADYLVLESTYGDRLHATTDPYTELADIINHTLQHHGSVLIPSFAVGRAQMLLYIITQLIQTDRIPKIPLYLNSPMAISATQLFNAAHDQHKLSLEECEQIDQLTYYVNSMEDSKALNDKKGPMIIISASGMATGGRVLHHLRTIAPDSNNAIVFAGFQAPGTRGQAMIDGVDRIKIHGEYYPVKAKIYNIESVSAHADYEEILHWLKRFKTAPKKTFITHGEPNASDALRRLIQDELKWKVQVPEYKSCVTL